MPAQSPLTPPADKDLEVRPPPASWPLSNNASPGGISETQERERVQQEGVCRKHVYRGGTTLKLGLQCTPGPGVVLHTQVTSGGDKCRGALRLYCCHLSLLSSQLDSHPRPQTACCPLDRQPLSPSLEQRQVALWVKNHRRITWGWQVFGGGR